MLKCFYLKIRQNYRFMKYFSVLKGYILPKKKKKKHLSSFTHPQISSVEHKMLMGKVDVYINKLH